MVGSGGEGGRGEEGRGEGYKERGRSFPNVRDALTPLIIRTLSPASITISH